MSTLVERLPPLPKPSLLRRVMPDDYRYGDVHGYTAEQMREYAARAVREAVPGVVLSDRLAEAVHYQLDNLIKEREQASEYPRHLRYRDAQILRDYARARERAAAPTQDQENGS